ncbi:MAG: hypothetical protein E7287_03440 [Lachnospiraceae bacterium]|nr:hypothetical protein [Lachnospiraceae bacterium]
MAFDLKNLYNKVVAEPATKLNRSVNKAIGKDVFQDVKPMERPKEFPPLSNYPTYDVPAPAQWTLLTGNEKNFTFAENTIRVSKNLDMCMQYVPLFRECATYYSKQFAFRYEQCVTDFDSLLYYFRDIYAEGLKPMIDRAVSLLLPFEVFSINADYFFDYHYETYNRAIHTYITMAGIQEAKNQQAENLGNQIGGSVRMQGGGFGFKGAMKGMAKAELFNFGMSAMGKYLANQTKMSDSEKATVFAELNKEIFFEEVYSDYLNTFLSLIHILSQNGVLGDVSTTTDEQYDIMINNLKNPMFPQDKVAPLLSQLIEKYPFAQGSYNVIKEKYGETDEIKQIAEYFTI